MAQSIFNPLMVIDNITTLEHFKGVFYASMYVSSYLLAAFSLTMIISIRSSKIFFFFLSIFFGLYSFDFFMQFLGSKNGFTYNDFALGMNEIGNYKNLLAFIDYIIYALALSAFFSFILYLIREKLVHKKINSLAIMMFFVAIVGTFVFYRVVDSTEYKKFPAFVKIPLYNLKYLKTPLKIKDVILDEKINVEKKPKYKNIIWIIDESITGTYLSINGYKKNSTPFLREFDKTDDMINFGVVNSISNCSGESNLFLRIGLNPKIYEKPREKMFDLPTIFQYAKRANFTTWLIDSQAQKDSLQDYLTKYDLEDIDYFKTLDSDTAAIDRDITAIQSVQKALKNRENNFIVIVKWGSHWPYLLNYDSKNAIFKPELDSALGGMIAENKDKIINTYLNSIRYGTDKYLKTLLSKTDLNDTIIFYTSDHGQTIFDSDKDLRTTHCHSVEESVKSEFSVPLIVFSKNAKEIFPKDNKKHSQIQIFPTILSLMGYSDELVTSYGKTLWDGYEADQNRESIIRLKGDIFIYDN
jgi:glucan phosphoethanolaminetransferase (alkaline phosphatase superfamily)